MLIFLDSNIVIFAVENPGVFGPKAQARLQSISHLATACENGCDVFLTHDNRLTRFSGITVEVLA